MNTKVFKKDDRDPRVKRRSFSWFRFFGIFAILMALAIGQSLMLANYFDSSIIPPEMLNVMIFYWAIVAGAYSFVSTIAIQWKYEIPLRQLSRASRQVARGDFSARLEPQHSEARLTHLDVMCLDFNTMVEELSSIEILKNDFISNVSHEIKTPLAVVQNYATLLQEDTLSKEQRKEYTDIIFYAAEQLSQLVTNVLRLSKLENQAILPAPQSYDVCRQLGDCVMYFADQLEQKQLDFSAEIEDKAFVMADESMLEIVWNNLLANAIKFTEPGGRITLTQATKGTDVWVTITDTGCGMDAETVKHIFDKFYQGDTSHRQQGNGLGLALVKRVIDLVGGEISVSSELNKGTTFTVRISGTLNHPMQNHCDSNYFPE